jgi:glycosyltransferase involved in cell wall biosynthesis
VEPLANRVTLSVLIPVHNERRTIEEILRRVQAVPIDKEIVVVDDASGDGTREFLEAVAEASHRAMAVMPQAQTGGEGTAGNIRVLFQERNRGKGAALRVAIANARGRILLVQDADLEYDPQDYPRLLEPIQRGVADAVYGSRFLGGPHRVLFYWHSVGNWLLTTLSNMLTDLNLTDVWSCYKVFRREVLEGIRLREDRFGFEPEITAKVARGGWRVYEVPISYHGRTYAEGKHITWKDGLWGIWCIVRYRFWL